MKPRCSVLSNQLSLRPFLNSMSLSPNFSIQIKKREREKEMVKNTETMIEESSRQRSLLASATDDEIHVAQILLDVARMIRTLESGSGLKWGSKRRRSRLDEAKSPYQKTDVGAQDMPPPPPPPPPKAETAAAASPVTPLAFSPSESDEQRSKHLSQKTSKKMSREVYIAMIEELSQRRDLLRGEVEKVTNYYKKLTAYNTQLKKMKQEVVRKEEPKLEMRINGNLAMEFIPKNHKMSAAQLYNGLGSSNHVGPFRIPYLNDEILPYQPLDADRRSRSAEARRKRMGIVRAKSMTMRRASVFKFPRNT